MLAYSVLMFLMGGVFLLLGIQIRRGKTDLIHFYHQRKVKDKAAYGKDFALGIFIMALGFFLSAVLALPGERLALVSVGAMMAGILGGLGGIFWAQRKHNRGIF